MSETIIDNFEETQLLDAADTLVLAPSSEEPADEEAPPMPPAAAAEIAGPQRFEFTGSGGEYFRIWLVNVLLTVLTLGVYSAWAKVRRLQYFYRNTRVAGAIFDYHGNPKAILKGRILALGLLAIYKVSYDVSKAAAVAAVLVLMAIIPWLLACSFRFKLANSSYRGLRMRFAGTAGEAYRTLILLPIILAVTGFFVWTLVTSFAHRPSVGVVLVSAILPLLVLAAAVPLAHYLLKRYQHDNAYFGQTPFFFRVRMVEFFKVYGKAIGLVLLGLIPCAIFGYVTTGLRSFMLATPLAWLFEFLYGMLNVYVLYLFVRPYLESRLQNLIWNSTELGDDKFNSTAGARMLFWIHASNLLLITLTFGLYKPFAAIRIAKYRLSNMVFMPAAPIDEFLGDAANDDVDAVAQEAGDFFDIDIAL